jgi:hypothetical protein
LKFLYQSIDVEYNKSNPFILFNFEIISCFYAYWMMIQRRWLQPFSWPWRDAHKTQQSTLGSCCKFYLWWLGHSRISNACDVFSNFSSHRYSFSLATGKTSASLLRLTRTTRHLFSNETAQKLHHITSK